MHLVSGHRTNKSIRRHYEGVGSGVGSSLIFLQYAFPFNEFAILRSHDYVQIPLELTQIMRMGTTILFAPIFILLCLKMQR